MKFLGAVALLVLALLSPAVHATWEVPRHVVTNTKTIPGTPAEVVLAGFPDDQAALIGEGFDLIAGQRRAIQCVNYEGTQRVYFRNKSSSLSEVVDEESLWRKMNTSISARAKFGGWSGGGSYDSTTETKTTSKNVTFVVKAGIKQYAETMGKASHKGGGGWFGGSLPGERIDLTDEAKQLLENNPIRFREVCGDGFVMQVTYGSEMYGIFDFSTLTFEERRDTVAKLDASGPGGVFSVDANSTVSQLFTSLKARVSLKYIEFGASAGAFPVTQQDLAKLYQSLGERTDGKERPIFLTIVRYSTLPSARVADSTDLVGLVDTLVRRVLRFQTLKKELDDAIEERVLGQLGVAGVAPAQYIFLQGVETKRRTLDGLRTTKTEVEGILDALRKKLDECLREQKRESCVGQVNNAAAVPEEDLSFRAILPLPVQGIHQQDLTDIKTRASSPDPASKKEAACYLAAIVAFHNVRRVNTVRARTDGDSLSESALQKAENKVFEGFDVTTNDCGPLMQRQQRSFLLR